MLRLLPIIGLLLTQAMGLAPPAGQAHPFRASLWSRRNFVAGLSTAPLLLPFRERALAADNSTGLSRSVMDDRLSVIPVFAVTTADGDNTYFTDKRKNGSPLAYFFSERKDAEALLPLVRAKVNTDFLINLSAG